MISHNEKAPILISKYKRTSLFAVALLTASSLFVAPSLISSASATDEDPIVGTHTLEDVTTGKPGSLVDYSADDISTEPKESDVASLSAIDIFPIQQKASFIDTWGAPRGGGTRKHIGTDVMSKQMNETYAAVSGTIRKAKNEGVRVGEYSSSYYLLLDGDDGRSYFYVHMNNDTPGRPNGCDGLGGMENAYSPKLVEYYEKHGTISGARVERGEHIGYVGSSGNAGCKVDHIHFEIWPDHGWQAQKQAMNPFPILKAAYDNHGAPYANKGIGSGLPVPPPKKDSPAPSKPAPSKPTPNASLTDGAYRISAKERTGTAAKLSSAGFMRSDVAVVVPSDTPYGALIGSSLASINAGPVLLSGRDNLSGATREELDRLKVRTVYTIGDMPGAANDLRNLGFDVKTITGSSPSDLANQVAEEVIRAHQNAPADNGDADFSSISNRHVIIVSDNEKAWPDALAASVLAANDYAPVLFSGKDGLDSQTAQTLADINPGKITIIGGTSRLSEKLESSLASQYMLVKRISGRSRIETALEVGNAVIELDRSSANKIFVATAANYPDALAAGPVLSSVGGLLILADPNSSNNEVGAWLRANANTNNITAIGGSKVMPTSTINTLVKATR